MNKYNNGKQPKNKTDEYLRSYKNLNILIDKCRQNFIHKCIWLVVALLSILALVAVYFSFNPQPTIKDGHIKRPYSQLLRFLDEEPADISIKQYEPTIPNIVQKDINRMLASNGDLDIIYYGANNSSYIQIVVDNESSSGIKFIVYEDYYD